jgi:hypothetical protein
MERLYANKSVSQLRLFLCVSLLVASMLAPYDSSLARLETLNVSVRSQGPQIGKGQSWRTRYTNHEYGYSLKIPRGLVGLSPPVPWPQHGIEVRISRNRDAYIVTNAFFSAVDYPSLDAAVDSDLQELGQKATELQIVNRHRGWLGRLEATRWRVRYMDPTSGAMLINETMTAVRRARHPEEGVLYTLTLVTTESRYQSDRKVFNRILRSWRMRPLPK